MLEAQVKARELRQKLFEPPNGRVSSELEIVPQILASRIRLTEESRQHREAEEARKAQEDFDRRVAFEAAIAAEQERIKTVREAAISDGEELPPRLPTVGAIINEVARRYGVSKLDILSTRRTANIVLPRQVIMYLARSITLLSLPQIGMRLGKRDHTTVLHGANKIQNLVDSHPQLATDISEIKRALGVA